MPLLQVLNQVFNTVFPTQ